jgi:hypothetical protein
MSSSRLIRLGGLVALVGFAFVFIMETIYFFALSDDVAPSVQARSSAFFVIELLYIIALLIAFLGLVGLYARQAEQVGVQGLIGFVMSLFGFVSFFAVEWARTFIWPILAQVIRHLVIKSCTGEGHIVVSCSLASRECAELRARPKAQPVC